MDLELNLACKTCGQRAENIIQLDNNKGYRYYCDAHKPKENIEKLKELANKGRQVHYV